MKLDAAFVTAGIGVALIVQALPIATPETLPRLPALSSRDIPLDAGTISISSARQAIHLKRRDAVGATVISPIDGLHAEADQRTTVLSSRTLCTSGMEEIAKGWSIARSEIRKPPVQPGFRMLPPHSEVEIAPRVFPTIIHDYWHKGHHGLFQFKRLSSQRRYEDLLRYSNEYDKGDRGTGRQLQGDWHVENLIADVDNLKNQDGLRHLPYRREGGEVSDNIYYEWAPLYNAALDAHIELENGRRVAGRIDLAHKVNPREPGGTRFYDDGKDEPLWSDPWKRGQRRRPT